jgi:hypothetical protein
MSRLMHTVGAKAVLAAAAVLLATSVTAAGATEAGATSVAVTGAAKAALTPVDHQLCYTVAAKGFHVPVGVRLVNQFSPNGFVPKIGPAVLVCNPTIKVLPTGKVFLVTNPRAHLACYSIAAPRQVAHLVVVSNQFGSAPLATGQPNLLCLPSWKSLTAPPHAKPVQPPGLSHFTCYTVKLPAGVAGYHPPPLRLRDEFTAKLVSARVSSVPTELCLPTEKIVRGQVSRIVNPVTHLLCFPVTHTPTRPRVFVQNQFGTAVVAIGHTSLLCVPSVKRVIH